MSDFVRPVPLEHAYRLINHGPVVLVSATYGGDTNVMAAAWVCALDFSPPKVTLVLDKATHTRALVEASGQCLLHVPTRDQARMVLGLGSDTARQDPHKLSKHGVQWFQPTEGSPNLVQGCAAWLQCRVILEPHNQAAYDLFIAEVDAAWADERVFSGGRWHFEGAPDGMRTLHYVAGGQFFVTGAPWWVEDRVPDGTT